MIFMNDSYFNELKEGEAVIQNIDDLTEENYHKGVHDKIVKTIVERLQNSGLYEIVKHNSPYYNEYRKEHGEADILAKAGNRYFAFEIKSTFTNRTKAHQQLDRDERFIKDYFTRDCNVCKFHVYGHSKSDKISIARVV